ncbi:MAG: TetM/TetW/TetO/TetS family tetracycline resistance ribosomal protection protein, partial [Clostridia bacterium]|nr:TetM/TetW/TetO/TetS family tetracycline resistance ribosomal protection protein [Clostridia bacterium]
MKKIVIGILAHVDSGKTTLSEAMLYCSGNIKKLGRVDYKNSFLDTFSLERERGITIFSKQAVLNYGDSVFTLLDTPGHVDFSAETERTLQVLDYAILVISGTDGVQSHTLTLWKLLNKYNVPCFIFVNKTDLPTVDTENIMYQLKERLSESCADFTDRNDSGFYERLAECDDKLLDEYYNSDTIDKNNIITAVKQRRIFPCMFGSALKLQGVDEFLGVIDEYTEMPVYDDAFAGKVFKISEDKQGRRLTYLKVTGGTLRVRDVLKSDKNINNEKVSQIRVYSGDKFTAEEYADAGTVCAVTGISFAVPGDGLGAEKNSFLPVLTPVLTYSLDLPPEINSHTALEKLKILENEDPQLNIIWNERYAKIQLRLMGEVQLEVLKAVISQRFGFEVGFGTGSIIYKETITDEVEGVGHFEPLKHYAEVHLLLKSGKRNSGIVFRSECREDCLDRNWQRLILSNLYEKTHIGVLGGFPLTDTEIILLSGKAHPKHTEGGDFRQAALRAVRQGLRCANSILLEPVYSFTLEVPSECIGRAISDIQKMSGSFEPPETIGEMSVINGKAPVSEISNYGKEVTQYTHGMG